MSVFRYFAFTIAALTLAMIAGCTSLNSKVGGMMNLDTDLTLKLIAETNINPDDKSRPSPLFIRLYELKSTRQFEQANFIDIYERDAQILGPTMLAKQTLKPLKPGDKRKDTFVLNPETHYVGLVAEFLQYQNAKFKVVIPVASKNVVASSATVTVSGNTMSVK